MKLRILPYNNIEKSSIVIYYDLPKLKALCRKHNTKIKDIVMVEYSLFLEIYKIYTFHTPTGIFVSDYRNIFKSINVDEKTL